MKRKRAGFKPASSFLNEENEAKYDITSEENMADEVIVCLNVVGLKCDFKWDLPANYILRREKLNQKDVNAVCVHEKDDNVEVYLGRKVGYIAWRQAEIIAPVIDSLIEAPIGIPVEQEMLDTTYTYMKLY